MVKDRLNELKQHQDNNKKKSIISTAQDNDNPHATNESSTLRGTFERTDVIKQWIGQIEQNNQDIRSTLRKLEELNPKASEDKLKSFFQNNTSLARQISEKLKQIDSELKTTEQDITTTRIINIQFTTSKKRFENAFIESNKLLENYKSIQKQIIKSQLVAKGYFNVSDEEVALLLENGADIQVFTDNILAETAEAKRILADVEGRHQQLLEIERMLIEVRDLFLEISVLVDSQQELVDRIEYQADIAVDTIGAVDLNTVRKSKKKYMKRKIYFIIAIIIIVIILLIILLK